MSTTSKHQHDRLYLRILFPAITIGILAGALAGGTSFSAEDAPPTLVVPAAA